MPRNEIKDFGDLADALSGVPDVPDENEQDETVVNTDPDQVTFDFVETVVETTGQTEKTDDPSETDEKSSEEAPPGPAADQTDQTDDGEESAQKYFKNTDKYTIVSRVAFLVGVNKKYYETENSTLSIDEFNTLSKNKNATIIRNLCILRTAFERSYRNINEKMTRQYMGLMSIPEVPNQSLMDLAAEGINLVRSNATLNDYIMETNRLISDRINNCKNLFPAWLEWKYLRELFIMPNGLTLKGLKAASAVYYANRSFYPFSVYINWKPEDRGNLFSSDRKFVGVLYEQNGDEFSDQSKVSDAGEETKANIYDFIRRSVKCVMVVDCENSDPYRLCSTLMGLDEMLLVKISKIILFNDVNTSSAWDILDHYTGIPVENKVIDRVKEDKSLVDITLATAVTKEFYKNDVDSFVLVSSDSDYWGLISTIEEAKFIVMVEHGKCGPDIKKKLDDQGIFYCYIDNFYSGDTGELKIRSLLRAARTYLDDHCSVNVNEMMNYALLSTRADLSPSERDDFYCKYVRDMYVEIDPDGKMVFMFGNK